MALQCWSGICITAEANCDFSNKPVAGLPPLPIPCRLNPFFRRYCNAECVISWSRQVGTLGSSSTYLAASLANSSSRSNKSTIGRYWRLTPKNVAMTSKSLSTSTSNTANTKTHEAWHRQPRRRLMPMAYVCIPNNENQYFYRISEGYDHCSSHCFESDWSVMYEIECLKREPVISVNRFSEKSLANFSQGRLGIHKDS